MPSASFPAAGWRIASEAGATSRRHVRVSSVHLALYLGGGFPIFTLAWLGNRLVQSLGWAGLVKVTSRWFSYTTYGSVMAVLSLSYLFGDAISRAIMSLLLAHGFGWRGVWGQAQACSA